MYGWLDCSSWLQIVIGSVPDDGRTEEITVLSAAEQSQPLCFLA